MANINENGNFIGARTKRGIKEWFQKGVYDVTHLSKEQKAERERSAEIAKRTRTKPIDYLINSIIPLLPFSIVAMLFVGACTSNDSNLIFSIVLSLICLGINCFRTYRQVKYWKKYNIFSLLTAIITSIVTFFYALVFYWINSGVFMKDKYSYRYEITAHQWVGIVLNIIGSVVMIIYIWKEWKKFGINFRSEGDDYDGLTEEEAEKEIIKKKMEYYDSKNEGGRKI